MVFILNIFTKAYVLKDIMKGIINKVFTVLDSTNIEYKESLGKDNSP